ncbi:MAG: threonine aldolase family protein [Rhodospirillales bacterium]
MNDIRINLHSDTQTKPTPAMKDAMAAAPLGDEQMMEDPTTNALQEKVAALLGKEAAVFMPSGTMCNVAAIAVHCRAGDEILCDRTAHIVNAEAGGLAVFAGAVTRTLDGTHGIFSAEHLEAAIRPDRRHAPRSRMVEIEQTANAGGGTIWPLETVQAVGTFAKKHGLVLHMDGARLLNAVVASGIAAKDYAAPCDTLWIDLSKGLGCPIGGVLAGSRGFIDEAWRWKQRLGGALRQSGMMAAAGIYALDYHVDRLVEDHANARLFAERVANLAGISVDLETVQTNMIFFDVSGAGITAHQMQAGLAKRGVRISAVSDARLRAVTHLDVSSADVEDAADAVRAVLEETPKRTSGMPAGRTAEQVL